MSTKPPRGKIYFEVDSVLGVKVRITEDYWTFLITIKHPPMRGREQGVKQTLADADEVRISKIDKNVYLYYKRIEKRYVCVVVRHLNGEGFVISAYPTDAMKEGVVKWKK
ncbi:MAG: DUF4258 domain-containing protein [Chloroflexota bacterium]|nr:MAG: DUF4258 domain-containing protein [Chloroflexota bacterium]